MASAQTVETVFQTDAGKEFRSPATLTTWTRQQALTKGVIWWLACWAVAGVCLFIPVVHFVATPAAFLAGPFIGVLMYKLHNGKTDISVEKALCPECQTPVEVGTSAENWPVTEECPNCHTRVTGRFEHPA